MKITRGTGNVTVEVAGKRHEVNAEAALLVLAICANAARINATLAGGCGSYFAHFTPNGLETEVRGIVRLPRVRMEVPS